MRFTLQLFALFCAISLHSFAQAPLVKQWDHTFGGNDDENLSVIIQTSDSGFFLAGYTKSDSGGEVSEVGRGINDFWILKTDTSGNKLWDKRFGGNYPDRLFSAFQTSDGGYILGGYVTSDSTGDVSQPSHGSMDYWLVRIDGAGNKIWDKRYGGASYDNFSSMCKTNDGGYLLGGWTFSDSTGDVTHHTNGGEDFWIVKVDSVGNIQWDKVLGGVDTDEMSCVIQLSDGGFLIGGNTQSDSSGDISQATRGGNDMWIVRTDDMGNIIWDKRFGGSSGDGIGSICATNDGGFILCGGTGSNISGDVTVPTRDTSSGFNWGDIWTVKIDSLGNKIWDKRYGGYYIDGASGKISMTSDHGFLIAANSFSGAGADKSENNFGPTQTWIIKADSTGDIIWDKTLFTIGGDESGKAIQCFNGSYLFGNNSPSNTGSYKSEDSRGNLDFWIIKFNEDDPPPPVANFSVSNSSVCEGGCVSFNNLSFNASNFEWTFPGGNPSTSTMSMPTNICYAASGTYDVTLIARSGLLADTVTITSIVNVLTPPSPVITQFADTLFAPSGFVSYQWFFNGQAIPLDTFPYHVITQDGDYIVLVVDTNGCPGLDTAYSITDRIQNLSLNENGITIFPNPADEVLNIRFPESFNDAELIITDVVGKILLQKKVDSAEQTITTVDFRSGIYFLQIVKGNDRAQGKFVKR